MLIHLLIHKWERISFKNFFISADRTKRFNVIVLGAGKNNDPNISPIARLSTIALMRLNEAILIGLLFPISKIIFSGPYCDATISQGELMVKAAISLGFPANRLLYQTDGYNSQTEALFYTNRFGTESPLIVCTSAMHMPRALSWFKFNGIKNVYAAPVDYHAPDGNKLHFSSILPNINFWNQWQVFLKEIIGYYIIQFNNNNII